MIWAMMQHLGYNMWHDEAIWRGPGRMKWSNFCTDHLLCTDASWNIRMKRLLEPGSGTNTLVIDVGEGVVYPSHPEIAVKGSWSAERLNDEVKRLKAGGLTVVPKLNFSTCHDFWLGDYARMISSPTYYKVVKDLIDDTCEIFDNPPYFHIGMDEEGYKWSSGNAYCVYREGDLWWHDIAFYAKCLEKHNSRPWMFSNPGTRDPKEFYARLPKSFLHSPWSYAESFAVPKGPADSDHSRSEVFTVMGDNGFDLVPCGSVWCGSKLKARGMTVNIKNYPNLAMFCKKHIPTNRLAGFFMVPWCTSTKESDFKFMAGCDMTDVARAWFEGKDQI
ncbi:MAG: hypothetical protein IKK82_09420 [Kiritimatiellae bacterium]|nr:hypothetical protein [Kiritimatiellia bacterium]